jgi:hypothetical protein
VTEFSQASVDHLKKMKRLHTLVIVNIKHTCYLDLIITIAGEVPNLRKFDFRPNGDCNKFIEEFAEKYPQKNLLVESL